MRGHAGDSEMMTIKQQERMERALRLLAGHFPINPRHITESFIQYGDERMFNKALETFYAAIDYVGGAPKQ